MKFWEEKIIISSKFWEVVNEIIKRVKPFYIIVYNVNIEKHPHMCYLKYMLLTRGQ